MWDVERSGEVERLLALASCNQQFLSHGLYAGVVRQLQVVDTGHYWGEEVIRVFWRLERLSHDRQRGIQAPETWDQPQVSDTDLVRTGLHILYIQKFKSSQVWLKLGSFSQGSCVKTLLFNKCYPCFDALEEYVCEVTHLQRAVWGSLWQTVERVSAAQHRSCSTPQTGTVRRGCKRHGRTYTSNVRLETFWCPDDVETRQKLNNWGLCGFVCIWRAVLLCYRSDGPHLSCV